MTIKNYFVLCIHIIPLSTALAASEQVHISIQAESTVSQRPNLHAIEKAYRKKLNAIKHELNMLQASQLLFDPEIYAPKIENIENQFNALKKELEKKQLTESMSNLFKQERAAVEREIIHIKELFKTPEFSDDMVQATLPSR